MSRSYFFGALALIIIGVSMLSILNSITGFATSESVAVVNITIANSVAINFTTDYVNFGAGTVTLGNDNASIDTLGNVVGGNWSATMGGFVLENIGSTNLTINLRSDKTALEFLGGTNPSYQYMLDDEEVGSCLDSDISLGSWYEVNTTLDGTRVCNLFSFSQPSNSLSINIKLVIPSDATVGTLSDTFTATASSV